MLIGVACALFSLDDLGTKLRNFTSSYIDADGQPVDAISYGALVNAAGEGAAHPGFDAAKYSVAVPDINDYEVCSYVAC